MKKTITFLFGILLVISCSTSSPNGTTTTTVVPLAPTSLSGIVVNSNQVNLSWTDVSTNETGFKIERKELGGNYALVGTVAADITNFSDIGVPLSSTYLYRVLAYNAVGPSLTYTNEIQVQIGPFLPTVITSVVTYFGLNSATGGGNVTSDGGGAILSKGVVWSNSHNPTIVLTTKTNEGPNAGAYTSTINFASGGGIYYIKAYATNSVGTVYGDEVTYDSTSPTYLNNIKPILDSKCVSCHSPVGQGSFPDLDTYQNVLGYQTDNGANGYSNGGLGNPGLLCSIQANSCTANRMPKGDASLTNSQISMILQWINNNYPQQ